MSFMNNGQHEQVDQSDKNCKKIGKEEDPDNPYCNLNDYFLNHPCAVNKSYEWPSNYKDQKEIEKKNYEDIEIKKEEEEEEEERFIPPSLRDDAPLAGILHPSLDNVDPRIFFKDFKPNSVLRFSRLFASNIKPSSKPEIWWPSRTFHRKVNRNGVPNGKRDISGPNRKKAKLTLNIVEPQSLDILRPDQEAALIGSSSVEHEDRESGKTGEGDVVQPWRNGPAKIWYDMMNVPSTSTNVNYGFKVKKVNTAVTRTKPEKLNDEASCSSSKVEVLNKCCGTNEDILLPYQVIEWEKQVILDGDEVRQKLLEELTNERIPSCGWIPTQYTRSYEHFVYAANNGAFDRMFDPSGVQSQLPINLVTGNDQVFYPTPTHSIFPSAPSDLDLHNWELNLVWDTDAMPENPEPIMLMVDFNDDPLIYGMPEDRRIEEDRSDRKENQYTKKSKMILGQVQQRQKQEEEEQMESSMEQFTDKDPFNLSNDEFYMPIGTGKTPASNSLLIQHSTPAQNIHRTFFPTFLTPYKLRHWHRANLSRRILRYFALNRFTQVTTTNKHQAKISETREKIKAVEGGGDIFFMREVADLTGRDGELVMIEYSEEHPVILAQTGMITKMKNYYKRKPGNDSEPSFDFGEMAFAHHIPFLGQLQSGQALQSVENNMYRAPIYRHQPKSTDFLLIRYKNCWNIRPCPALFVAGQQCPLYEVPSPNSKRATVFVRDFLFAYIYRLFWTSEHIPRRLKMEDIRQAFPHYAESNIRKRLKQCSQFTRPGAGQESFWVLKPEFRLPTKEEVLAMITPEMCCVQYSMMAAEQRLKDAGYGEKYFFTPENDEGSDDEVTIEDEIRCAPWNTSRAFLASQRDKCLLDQSGIADPTGCGQGFSYVRVSQKPQKDDMPPVPKKLVTGTNADLRKLPLKEAKEICRGYGVKEEEINALTRWEIIDVIRTLSTQAAKATKEGESPAVSGMARFARGNTRFSSADMQEKYRKHCQRMFDSQNHTLANAEVLSTDDDSSDADSDNEELASRLEDMLNSSQGKKNISVTDKKRLEFETEEKERQDLKRMIHGDTVNKGNNENRKEATAEEKKDASKFGEDVAMSASKISGITANQKLKIYRTIKNEDGTESTRVEVVTRPQLIEAYTRIRMTRDDTFIQVYAQMDEQYKEEKRKKKRRLQDQLRRMKKNEEKQQSKPSKTPVVERKPIVFKPNLQKMRCSACHAYGHMKTNKNCPLYGKDPLTPIKESGTDVDETSQSTPIAEPSEMMLMEGTKLKINKKALMANLQQQQLLLQQPTTPISRKPKSSVSRLDSLNSEEPRIASPITMRADDIEEDDIDFSSMIPSTPSHSSHTPAMIRGTGRTSSVGSMKRRTSLMPEEDYLHGPAKSVHRLRADPKVTMSTLLTEIVNELKLIPGADHHLIPVNAKKVTDYYQIVKNPMDLQKIKMKIADQSYELRKDFLGDVKQMLDNSILYNGDNNVITVAAQQMLAVAGKRMCEREEKFISLEKQINPLLDDNDRVGFSHLLCEIVQKCKNIPKSAIFHSKVDSKKVPSYYSRVNRPMDLGTIEQNAKKRVYTNVHSFKSDVEQIYRNSEMFNGPAETNSYTAKALEIFSLAHQLLDERKEQLAELEANINQDVIRIDDSADEYDDIMDDVRQEVSIDMTSEVPNDETRVIGDEELDDMDEQMEDYDDMHEGGMQQMDDEDSLMWDDTMNATSVGQVMNDLEMSDSDEDERLDEMRRPNLEDDHRLDSF